MSQPSRREQQKQERRNQLIDAALALFAERGVDATTIRDIAERAGVAQGLVYHYFESKDALLWAIIERDNPLPILSGALTNVAGRPVREVLLDLATRAYELLETKRLIIAVVAREAMTRPELQQRIFALQRIGIGLYVAYMRSRIAAGEVREHDPAVSARMLIGSMLALRLSDAPPGYVPAVVDALLRGILA